MSEEQMTPEEKRWFARLGRVLREMPKSVELQVHHNTIQMNRAGAREEAFQRDGDGDSAEGLSFFQVRRVFPCSESM